MEVNIILDESQSAKSFEVSQMIHQQEFAKVKQLIEKQLIEASQKNTEVHHTIPIFGERGSGKTSFLKSVITYYSDHADTHKVCVLGMIDPTMIEEKGHVFLLVVSLINKRVREELDRAPANLDKKIFLADWECALNKLAKGIPSLDNVGETYENSAWADDTYIMRRGLDSVCSAFELSAHFNECVERALKILNKEAFLLAFDDIDVDFRKGWPVLETIRKYLSTPRIITLLSGDLHLYSTNVRKQQWNNFGKALLKNEYDGSDSKKVQYTNLVDEMENQYMLKLFKAENRVKLFTVDEAIRRSNIAIKVNGEDIEECYDKVLRECGVKNKKYLNVYKTFFLNLPIRSQIHFLSGNLSSEFKTTYSYDAFLSQMLAEGIDVDMVGHTYEKATIVILRYLIKSNRLEGAYQLLPRFEEPTVNACLTGLLLMWCNYATSKPSLVFDYLIRIGFMRNFAEIIMNNSEDDSRLTKLCNQSGVFETNMLNSVFGHAMAHLYNDENLFGVGVFFPIRGLIGKSKNTNTDALDYVFKNKSEVEKKLAYLPAVMLYFDYKNESRLYYSIYSILAAIGDILRAKELRNDVMTTFNEVSLLRSFQVSGKTTKENNNENEELQAPEEQQAADITDEFKEELETWTGSFERLFHAPYVTGKISTRFYYSQRNIYQSLKEEKDENNKNKKVELGRITSLSIMAFLNATLIEEAMVNYDSVPKKQGAQTLDKLNINNVRTSSKIFEDNLKFIYDNEATDAIKLTKALIECPLVYPYIEPEVLRRIKTIMGKAEDAMNINVFSSLNGVTLKSQIR